MKRIFAIISLALLFCSVSLQAAPVTPSQAMDIAKKIFAAQPATKAGTGTLKIVWDGEDVATKAAQPAFYVIARDGGGFVIVAGDDNVTPILAISDHSEFKVEGMPENVKWWMERMKAYVRSSTSQTLDVRDQWSKLTDTKAGAAITGTVTVVSDYPTPEWGQGATYHEGQSDERQVFNSRCPKVDGNYTITGCVATAIGEVMTTLSGLSLYSDVMPGHGIGTVEPYELPSKYSKDGYVPANTPNNLEDTVYVWANLRQLTGTEAIKKAIADGNGAWVDNMDQLLADVGAVMHAYYRADNTSAYTQQTADSMAKYYGFNKAAYFDRAANYSAHQWREKLKGQLAIRPIVYSGRTEDDKYGHAFVFDGYGTYGGADVFHVNFGWNGSCNGYYYETNLDVDTEKPQFNYSWECGAVFDFYPAPNSTVPIKLEAVYGGEDFPGVIAELVSPGKYVLYGYISNTGKVAYDGKVKFAVRKKNGSIQDIEGAITSFSLNVNAIHSVGIIDGEFAVLFPISGISFGDQVVCYYKEDMTKADSDASAWKLLPGPIATAISAWPLTPAAFIKTESSYSLNDWFVFELMNNNYIYPKTTWTITDPDGQTTTYQQSDKEFQLTKTGKYKIQAATAQTAGTVLENLVTIITVGSPSSSSSNR